MGLQYGVDLKSVLIYSISVFVVLLWISLSYFIHSSSIVNKHTSRGMSDYAFDLWSVNCGTGPRSSKY